MRWRRLRRLLLVAALAGAVGWWYTHGQPSFGHMVDAVTQPLFGSKAAVHESERNRVEGQAATTLIEQTESQIETLREGLTFRQVRELLGEPNTIETVSRERGKPEVVRWTYKAVHRVLVFEDGRVVSIAVR